MNFCMFNNVYENVYFIIIIVKTMFRDFFIYNREN